jgi:hypothetical protein
LVIIVGFSKAVLTSAYQSSIFKANKLRIKNQKSKIYEKKVKSKNKNEKKGNKFIIKIIFKCTILYVCNFIPFT